MANAWEKWLGALSPSSTSTASRQSRRRGTRAGAVWTAIRVAAVVAASCGLLMAARDLAIIIRQPYPPAATADQAAPPAGLLVTGPLEAKQMRIAAAALDPELMQVLPDPGSFDPKFRSPCWATTLEGRATLRCLPAALISGVFHGGSSSLSLKLLQHPDVVSDRSSNSQFWAEEGKAADDYLAGFSEASKAAQRIPNSTFIIDQSPSTFTFYWSAALRTHRASHAHLQSAWGNCSQAAAGSEDAKNACLERESYPHALAADRRVAVEHGLSLDDLHVPLLVRAMYGDFPIKLVVVVRNPIDRFQSGYFGLNHYKDVYGENPEGLLRFATEQIAAFEGCVARGHTPVDCVLYFESLGLAEEKTYFHCDQLFRGTYSVYLERWRRALGRESILVVKAEDYFAHSRETLQKVISFLGLPAADDAVLQAMDLIIPEELSEEPRTMLPEARHKLLQFYEPFNAHLHKLVGMDGGDQNFLEWNL